MQWKTLISAGLTPSGALTAGVARLAPNGRLRAHHHEQAEIYVILAGCGTVTIDGVTCRRRRGGDGVHPRLARSTRSRPPADGDLHFAYVLAADAFEDVTYVFDAPDA